MIRQSLQDYIENEVIPRYAAYGFEWGETNVEMETNTNVQSQWGALKTELHKRRRCYKKQIAP